MPGKMQESLTLRLSKLYLEAMERMIDKGLYSSKSEIVREARARLSEKLILEAIPSDEWINAVEIAEKTGLHKTTVASTIGYNLLEYIERKRFPESRYRVYLYRRIE